MTFVISVFARPQATRPRRLCSGGSTGHQATGTEPPDKLTPATTHQQIFVVDLGQGDSVHDGGTARLDLFGDWPFRVTQRNG